MRELAPKDVGTPEKLQNDFALARYPPRFPK